MKGYEPLCAIEYHSSKGPLRRYRLEGGRLTKVPLQNTGYFTAVKQFFRVRGVPGGVCVYMCGCVYMCICRVCLTVCLCVCYMCPSVYVCVHERCVSVCMHICICLCTYACVRYVCMYVCMCKCVCVYCV